jgi:hypothetical protein
LLPLPPARTKEEEKKREETKKKRKYPIILEIHDEDLGLSQWEANKKKVPIK